MPCGASSARKRLRSRGRGRRSGADEPRDGPDRSREVVKHLAGLLDTDVEVRSRSPRRAGGLRERRRLHGHREREDAEVRPARLRGDVARYRGQSSRVREQRSVALERLGARVAEGQSPSHLAIYFYRHEISPSGMPSPPQAGSAEASPGATIRSRRPPFSDARLIVRPGGGQG